MIVKQNLSRAQTCWEGCRNLKASLKVNKPFEDCFHIRLSGISSEGISICRIWEVKTGCALQRSEGRFHSKLWMKSHTETVNSWWIKICLLRTNISYIIELYVTLRQIIPERERSKDYVCMRPTYINKVHLLFDNPSHKNFIVKRAWLGVIMRWVWSAIVWSKK